MRFFVVDPGQIRDGLVTITGEDVNHIRRVLRLRAGDELQVLDGHGTAYLLTLEEVGPQEVRGRVKESWTRESEPLSGVTLVQGLPKGEKMDFIVQKCTELGISRIIPTRTRYSIVEWEGEKARARAERWRKIVREAAKQCGRSSFPEIEEIQDWSEVLGEGKHPGSLRLMPWEEETERHLRDALAGLPQGGRVSIFIGPEGGFSPQEVSQAREAGITTVTLGPRILRTETAGPAVVAMILFALGDLG